MPLWTRCLSGMAPKQFIRRPMGVRPMSPESEGSVSSPTLPTDPIPTVGLSLPGPIGVSPKEGVELLSGLDMLPGQVSSLAHAVALLSAGTGGAGGAPSPSRAPSCQWREGRRSARSVCRGRREENSVGCSTCPEGNNIPRLKTVQIAVYARFRLSRRSLDFRRVKVLLKA